MLVLKECWYQRMKFTSNSVQTALQLVNKARVYINMKNEI